MGKAGGIGHKILIWSYERGTLQYDIICILILTFVFFVPRTCFIRKPIPDSSQPHGQEKTTPTSKVAAQPSAPDLQK